MKKIRIGVLSFAHGHIHAYCNRITDFEDAILVACWDDNEARGREAAERYGMEFESSYEALVNRADIDAVIITSETNKHAELTVAAASAGQEYSVPEADGNHTRRL